ncbi:MAG: sulfotransferase [Actinomycetota bacterium]
MPLPDFVVAGAMRSGTTFLARCLDSHPAVAVPTKEIYFFDRNWDRGVGWYESLFQGLPPGSVIGEATPSYMFMPKAASRMASLLPQAKVVVTLRNPVDRAHSHYWHNHERKVESLTFEDALAAEPDRIAAGGQFWRYSYLSLGDYLPQLERLIQHYPRERLKVLLYEETHAEPVAAVAGVYRHLGVDDGFVSPLIHRRINGYKRIYSAAVRDHSKKLPKRARDAVGRIIARDAPLPSMDPGLRQELIEDVRPRVAALGRWLGIDLEAFWLDTSDSAPDLVAR